MQMQEQIAKQAETLFPAGGGAPRRPSDERRRASRRRRFPWSCSRSPPGRQRRRSPPHPPHPPLRLRRRPRRRPPRRHRRRPSSPGPSSAGTTYVAEMAFDSRALKTWRPVKDVQPGKNVAWTIVWTNLDQFPALKTPADAGTSAALPLSRHQDRDAVGLAGVAVDGDLPLRDPRVRARRGDGAGERIDAPTLTPVFRDRRKSPP